jgi:hypothetical protein
MAGFYVVGAWLSIQVAEVFFPAWAETIAYPRIARMLDDVKVELERQRALVEQTDAEHDFRAEIAAIRSVVQD